MGTTVESGRRSARTSGEVRDPAAVTPIEVRLLGPLQVARAGGVLVLPASRKVRALLAYLALAPRATPRSQLCELLWDAPSDPRGELRWCLSRLRGLVDAPGRQRIHAQDDSVRLDFDGCRVDALEIAAATSQGADALPTDTLRSLCALFGGDFLEGLELERSPVFQGWLVAQRRRFRGIQVALLEALAGRLTDSEVFEPLEHWLRIAPFDVRAHALLLGALARLGRIRDGDVHVEATVRLFDADGLDPAPLREVWRAARARTGGTVDSRAAAAVAADLGDARGRSDTIAVEPDGATRRASIVVMPFLDTSTAPAVRGGTADALAHDVTTRLAKLRSLFVIAQGTAFALNERHLGPAEAARALNVDYVVSGAVRRQERRLAVNVELTATRSARIVWAEIFNQADDDAFAVLDEIGNRIVASVAGEIELIERNRAILKPPDSLDAWEAHHRGLWHMYRFNQADNARAMHFFASALRLDPTFARAWAGLSFTHFQNAFQGWAPRAPEVERAFDAAARGLQADERDPAAHWAMGRALWLHGRHEESVFELERAVDISPNFALGHYTLAFVQAQSGDPLAAIAAADHSRRLSPFDPLLFAMLASRAIALVRLGRFDEAAQWAVRAAARPNAHLHIQAIAACSLALAGDGDQARAYADTIARARPQYRVADLTGAFQFEPEALARFVDGARRLGLA